jgi:hypothetical protein
MHRIARRLTIITLTMAIFAFSFSALVQGVQEMRGTVRLEAGAASACQPISGMHCRSVL